MHTKERCVTFKCTKSLKKNFRRTTKENEEGFGSGERRQSASKKKVWEEFFSSVVRVRFKTFSGAVRYNSPC